MNKVVKKIAAVALSGLLVASVFAGCSGGSAKDTYTVGICQSMQHPALDKATEGFKKALTDKLGDKVTLHTDGLQVTATTTNGVAEGVYMDGTASGSMCRVRF